MIYNSNILSFQVEKNTSELEIGSEYQLFCFQNVQGIAVLDNNLDNNFPQVL